MTFEERQALASLCYSDPTCVPTGDAGGAVAPAWEALFGLGVVVSAIAVFAVYLVALREVGRWQ